jgi:hypothetical protein
MINDGHCRVATGIVEEMVRKQCLGGDKYTKEPFYKMWLSAVAKKKMWLSAQDILYTTLLSSFPPLMPSVLKQVWTAGYVRTSFSFLVWLHDT